MDWVTIAGAVTTALTACLITYLVVKARCRLVFLEQQRRLENDSQITYNALRDELTRSQSLHESSLRECRTLNDQLKLMTQDRDDLQQQLTQLRVQLASVDATLVHNRTAHQKEIKLLNDTKLQLSQEFEQLANRIFEDKAERFTVSSQRTLDTAINPLREQLRDFKAKVEDVYDKESRDRVSLVAELGQLKQLNVKMSEDAINLTRALKGDNKAQGNWGEIVLERVLEESGLRKGYEYETQLSSIHQDGSRRMPDVVIRLPDKKDIVIDSKVSLIDYERYCKADNHDARQAALKGHIQSIKTHIQQLSAKSYQDLPNIRTLDFVFIFVPIESAFMLAFEHDSSVYRQAYDKNIIVVGPTTLLATLRTVQSIWRHERQNKYAEEIARQAGTMHDKFVSFIDDLTKVSQYLDKAKDAQQLALQKLSSGRGNLVASTLKLEALGAKVKKKIPDVYLKEQGELTSINAIDALSDSPETE